MNIYIVNTYNKVKLGGSRSDAGVFYRLLFQPPKPCALLKEPIIVVHDKKAHTLCVQSFSTVSKGPVTAPF